MINDAEREAQIRREYERLVALATPGPWTANKGGLNHPAWVCYSDKERAKIEHAGNTGSLIWAADEGERREDPDRDVRFRGGEADEQLVAFLRNNAGEMFMRLDEARAAAIEEAAQKLNDFANIADPGWQTQQKFKLMIDEIRDLAPQTRRSLPMSEASKFADLIARLEAATEGSRELDCAIEIAVGRCDPTGELLDDEWYWNEWRPFGSTEVVEPLCQPMPYYTTSLDAALTLVPEGWWRQVFETRNGKWDARLIRQADSECITSMHAASGPLAVCITAIRALI